MKSGFDFEIGSSSLSYQVKQFGFVRFSELAEHVRSLPYSRPKNSEPLAVLRERCGTCSSKHRLLALVAQDSGRHEVQLAVGLYEMSKRNTPGVRQVLADAEMPFIPEAHCYLIVNGERLDFTGLSAGEGSPFESLLAEHFVDPRELPVIKDSLHKEFVRQWAHARGLLFERVWRVREACVAALSANKAFQPTLAKPRAAES